MDNGQMINNMAEVRNPGLMEQNTKEPMKMEKNMVKVRFIFRMVVGIKESSLKTIFKDMGCIVGQTKENILDNGKKIK